MSEAAQKTIEERARELATNPEIHDPEALRFLIQGFTQKTLDLVREVTVRDAIMAACRRLAAGHRGQCGVTDAIAMVLSQSRSLDENVQVTFTAIPMTDTGFKLPDGEGADILSREDERGHFARATSTKDSRILADVGPYPTHAEAIQRVHEKAIEALGFGASSSTGDFADALRAAMGGGSTQVH